MWIVKQFGLDVGDALVWRLEAVGSDFRILVEPVRKRKK
jgi:hypothetical protein